MARTFINNISGRKLDISVIGDEGPLTFAKNEQLAGILKLSNLFAITLLTPVGSDLSEPKFGTILFEFTSLSSSQISPSFLNLAVSQASVYIKNTQREDSTIPDDELLDSASLSQYSLSRDTISMVIDITSVAGENVAVIVPVTRS